MSEERFGRRAPGSGAPSPAPDFQFEDSGVDALYDETAYWHTNLGGRRIHAKRMGGRFRVLKWAAASIYILYFILPYFRYGDRQAILFDIPARKYHFFGLTFWPQDAWILTTLLLSFFIFLYVSTALAGRVFCGYFCWQTVWIDVYTWIEGKIEGTPSARSRLDGASWGFEKIWKKSLKTAIFLSISLLTGITFTAYFIDVYELWSRFFNLAGPIYIWTVPMIFLIGSYVGVALMREQICFWLCPYARLQGVMLDEQTLLPTYDFKRGEPRGKISASSKGSTDSALGDCIDCSLCLAVCPTGIDIRHGQQEGCITCGLCIDACDMVMEKTRRPLGLVRYSSLAEARGAVQARFWHRPRVVVYFAILALTSSGFLYGLTTLGGVSISVTQERQPLFVRLSDGRSQNRYTVKVVNKASEPLQARLSLSGIEDVELIAPERLEVAPGSVKEFKVSARSTPVAGGGPAPLKFTIERISTGEPVASYDGVFVGG